MIASIWRGYGSIVACTGWSVRRRRHHHFYDGARIALGLQ
ncbi:hypothetical protein F3Y22_tig00110402pilonHSYRG00276 [Hibiscus syriacus]|uniref:Uncharacterized protein n=1 Tax=Hibiscus syriacus TaxID=106335 RepID=A0A6A3ARD8_HIBSY|nr:hypothetical protein F3Y22_tig00110402pilonHSYRG00276 [Hibiscus syriacus]